MAMTGFICHDDYLNKTAKLSDEEVGRLFRALMKYHATGNAEDLDGRESIAFDFIREDIDRAEESYKAKCEKNRTSRLAAIENERQRTSTNVNERLQEQEQEQEKNNNKNNKESVREKQPLKRFTPPTVDEVKAYCSERRNSVDPQRFVDYYTANGWKVGKNPMKDWQATVRTWERADGMKQTVKLVAAQDYGQRDYSGVVDELADEQARLMDEFKSTG